MLAPRALFVMPEAHRRVAELAAGPDLSWTAVGIITAMVAEEDRRGQLILGLDKIVALGGPDEDPAEVEAAVDQLVAAGLLGDRDAHGRLMRWAFSKGGRGGRRNGRARRLVAVMVAGNADPEAVEEPYDVDLDALAEDTRLPRPRIVDALHALADEGALSFTGEGPVVTVTLDVTA